MKIGNFNTDENVLIVAEIGNNHEGSIALAEEMIRMAAQSGVDAVKFQTIIPERLVSVRQKERLSQLKRFQLIFSEFEQLSKVADNENVMFLSTPFDIESALFLNDLVPAFKIASGDNNFFPLIEVIAGTGKPIIMSNGFMEIEEIKESAHFVRRIWDENGIRQELALLHCVSVYPTPPEKTNLRAINELKSIVHTVGYSDHTLGIEAAVLSVALGARIIEKHFTLDKNHSDFHDHSLSSDPEEMRRLVCKIKSASEYLGHGKKGISAAEEKIKKQSRRSIVAAHDLNVGHKININDLDWIRPDHIHSLSPGDENKVLGKSLLRNIVKGDMISLEDID